MEYGIKIARSDSLTDAALTLERWVNDAIEYGFKPQGQFQVFYNGGYYTMLQQMIKED